MAGQERQAKASTGVNHTETVGNGRKGTLPIDWIRCGKDLPGRRGMVQW